MLRVATRTGRHFMTYTARSRAFTSTTQCSRKVLRGYPGCVSFVRSISGSSASLSSNKNDDGADGTGNGQGNGDGSDKKGPEDMPKRSEDEDPSKSTDDALTKLSVRVIVACIPCIYLPNIRSVNDVYIRTSTIRVRDRNIMIIQLFFFFCELCRLWRDLEVEEKAKRMHWRVLASERMLPKSLKSLPYLFVDLCFHGLWRMSLPKIRG